MSRYNDITIGRADGKRYYITSYYPFIPLSPNDIYAITDFGDRLDVLANQFYGDPNLYWVIAAANPDSIRPDSLSLKGGIQLRIPSDARGIVTIYNRNNNIGTSLTSVVDPSSTNTIPVGTGIGGY